jgi:hypothetical protein
MRRRVVNEYWIRRDVKGSGNDLPRGMILVTCLQMLRKTGMTLFLDWL